MILRNNPTYKFYQISFLSSKIFLPSIAHLTLRQKLIGLTSIIALMQFLLHLGAMNSYGFHQDELLYITLGDHMSWGYRETPPFIALMSNVGDKLFGDSLIGMRLIPAIFAGAIVHLTGIITIRLGGRYFAIAVACTAVAFSPAFLATGGLFIPQVFDEFFWLVCCYIVICMVQEPKPYLPYILGIIIGVGILAKYTILIYLLGILIGIILNRHSRGILKTGNLMISFSIACIVIAPHLVWQFQNGFPGLLHLDELKETQLIKVGRLDFLLQHLVSNGTGLFIWGAGFIYLIISKSLKPYVFMLWGFLVVMIFLIIFQGKPYYAFASYPPLFAAGGLCFERIFQDFNKRVKGLIQGILLMPNLILALVVLPYLPIQTTSEVFQWTYKNLKLDFPLRWEDQKIHMVNQNFADMIGWDELAIKTSNFYKSLSPSDQAQTVIFAEGYGAAAAFNYYARKYPMPKIVSLSSSFSMWAPEQITAKNLIFFSSESGGVVRGSNYMKFASIDNPYSRVYGKGIYLIRNVKKTTLKWYASEWSEKRDLVFNFRRDVKYGSWF